MISKVGAGVISRVCRVNMKQCSPGRRSSRVWEVNEHFVGCCRVMEGKEREGCCVSWVLGGCVVARIVLACVIYYFFLPQGRLVIKRANLLEKYKAI